MDGRGGGMTYADLFSERIYYESQRKNAKWSSI